MGENGRTVSSLGTRFSPLSIWAISIGTSIGWGSFIVTCNTYLLKSGILGTVFGLLIGMAVILVITWNLQYTIRRTRNAGGIYMFEKQNNSHDLGFLTFWFVLLTYLAVLWANITSVPLFTRFFVGDIFQFGFHYRIFGYEVWMGEALLSIVAVLLIALLCIKSVRLPKTIMVIAALAFVAGFTVCAVMAIFRHNNSFNYTPLYAEGSNSFAQIVRIAAISPWAFIGFENVAHFSEEYNFPIKKVRGILISSVVVTTLLYLFVSMLSISAYPPEYGSWIEYIRDMGNLDGIKAVPAFYAANHYLGQAGVSVLMLSLFGVIMTSLIGNLLALSRLLFAAGREGDAPRSLGKLNKKGIPSNAIVAVAAVSMFIPFLGRTAIGWIVDGTMLGATLIYGLISQAVFVNAKKENRRAEKITGAVGFALMLVFALLLLIPGLLPFNAMETESYVLFIIWSVLGLIYFRMLVRKKNIRATNQRIVVWVILLLLVLFASMMWVSRATEKAVNSAVTQIYEYHESHPSDGTEQTEANRADFLQEQAKKIGRTNTLYTVVSLALFLLSTGIMLNNYQENKRLDQNLILAKERATTDPLTGAKNKYAFSQAELELDEKIETEEVPFAIMVCDVNNLKIVNDIKGHKAGDEHLRRVYTVIKQIFKNSTVYRIGGDEFAVICENYDYEHIDELLEQMEQANRNSEQGMQIAFGMARFAGDLSVAAVFERADGRMYEKKLRLKAAGSNQSAGSGEIYKFDEHTKRAYESSAISFVIYQNIGGEAFPILASDGFCRNTGMHRESVLAWLRAGMFERMHPDDVGLVSKVSEDFLNHNGGYDVVFRCKIGVSDVIDDETVKYAYIHGLGSWQTMPDGTDLAVITYANLSTSQKTAREQMERYAVQHKDMFYTDPLTELPNINYLHEFGTEKINVMHSGGKTVYVVYSDIYSMQSYNVQYGYKEGDKLLCLAAETFKEQFPGAFIARGADDQFVIIVSTDKPSQLKNRLIKTNKIIRKNAYGNTSGIRSGVFATDADNTEIIDALDSAKLALRRIDNNMNREVAFFSREKNDRYMRELYILENLDKAIEEDRIKIYYHGLYRMATGKVAAFEALARWSDPDLGMIYPAEFIPVLLKYHQLYKLDLYIFEQVCKEIIIRHKNKLDLVPVSVNFSRQDFDHFNIVEEMNRIYDKYKLNNYTDKTNIIVEITEQDLALGKENLRNQLHQIRESGYRIWMDDFGSGYSSLNMFSQFDFDLVKYDMDLIRRLDDNGGVNRIILKEVTVMLKKIGVKMLIEGVETKEQLEFVKEIDCDLAQGYYFHHPEALEKILTDIKNGRPAKVCESDEERREFNKIQKKK